MTVQKLDIKSKIASDKKSDSQKTQKPKKEDSGSIIGGLAGTAMAAMPLIPNKFKVMAGVGIFFLIYGVGSFIADIISLF